MPYVNHRWLGGLLTNFGTITNRIKRLHDLERYEREGQLDLLPTRERLAARADLERLRANLGGVKNMSRTPDAMFVVDLKVEAIAVKEARRLRIPIIGLVDTNCDPDEVDYVIPGNDDAIKSCLTITRALGTIVGEGREVFRAEEERARREAEEKARRDAEERARRDAEERAKREAEDAARREAEAAARREAQEAAAAQAAQAAQQAQAAQAAEAQKAQAAAAAAPAEAAPAEAAPAEAAPAEAAPAPAEPAPAPAEDAPAEAAAATDAPATDTTTDSGSEGEPTA
jgi:small subunit ribosomal protein S2